MFSLVTPYRYLLLTMYLYMTYIANPALFVCSCRSWICLDIVHFYEEQRQPSGGLPLGGFTICTAVTAPPLVGFVVWSHLNIFHSYIIHIVRYCESTSVTSKKYCHLFCVYVHYDPCSKAAFVNKLRLP